MDFWDLTKLLARRWLVALPMLALSAALTVLALGHVKPDYIATAYVQIVPPVLGPTPPGQATPEMRNPWLSQNLQSIGNAAIIRLLDHTVVEQLKAEGYTDSYTIEMGSTTPMVTMEVVGHTKQQASDTADQLVQRFTDSIASLQTAYGVGKADMITTTRLDGGTNVEMSDSKVKRALVAVVGAGLLSTAGVTVGVDAWLRRRRRRKLESAPSLLLTTPSSGQVWRPPPPPTGMSWQRSNGAEHSEPEIPVPAPPLPPPPSGSTYGSPVTRDITGLAGVNIEYQPAGYAPPKPVEVPEREPEPAPPPDGPVDSTIVLPLSMPGKEQWPGRNGERMQRP